jgi:hypothetical protein
VASAPNQRVVLIGASNMTRGLAVLIETCRRAWGDPVEIMAALGHGRSYGLTSNVLGRRLPSILECGLWRALDDAGPTPAVAVVGDVGNDVLYGAPVPQILAWVDEVLTRLGSRGVRTILTSLPPPALTVSRAHFHFFRTVFFPARKLRFESTRVAVPALDQGLRDLAVRHNTVFVELRPEWYRIDPIHIRPGRCRRAWAEILTAAAGTPVSPCPRVGIRSLGTYRLFPERQWMFGREMRRDQPCGRLPAATTISLY